MMQSDSEIRENVHGDSTHELLAPAPELTKTPTITANPIQQRSALVAGCFGMLCVGSIYIFGLWSESITPLLPDGEGESSQSRLNQLFEAALVANYLPLAGITYHFMGARFTVFLGAFMTFVGYLAIYLAETTHAQPPYWQLLISFATYGSASGFVDAACIGACLSISPPHLRGANAGLLKGFYGLSASLYSMMFLAGVTTDQLLLILGPGATVILVIVAKVLGDAAPKQNTNVDLLMQLDEFDMGIGEETGCDIIDVDTSHNSSSSAEDAEILEITRICESKVLNKGTIMDKKMEAQEEIQEIFFKTISQLMNALALLLALTAVLNGITELPRPVWFVANGLACMALLRLALLPYAFRKGIYSLRISTSCGCVRGYEKVSNETLRTEATAADILHRYETGHDSTSLTDNTAPIGISFSDEEDAIIEVELESDVRTDLDGGIRSRFSEQQPSRALQADGLREREEVKIKSDGGEMVSLTPLLHVESLSQVCKTKEYWWLFSVLCIGMGSGLMVVSNMSRMVDAMEGDRSMLAVMVSLFSWSNCVGRLVVGRASDRDMKLGRPRALWLMYACATMGIAHLLMAANHLRLSVLAVVIAGGAYGSFWTLDPTCVADFFPQELFGQIYGTLALAPSLGSLVLSAWLSSAVYAANLSSSQESRIAKHSPTHGPTFRANITAVNDTRLSEFGTLDPDVCVGSECFFVTHMVIVGFCGVGMLLSWLLARASQKPR